MHESQSPHMCWYIPGAKVVMRNIFQNGCYGLARFVISQSLIPAEIKLITQTEATYIKRLTKKIVTIPTLCFMCELFSFPFQLIIRV